MSRRHISRRVQALSVAVGVSLALSYTPLVTAASSGARQLEEVVVTAERREASVQDTAISMTAFDSSFLEDFNITNQNDLQSYLPSTVIQHYDASIRGLGRTFRTLGGEPGVAIYRNRVYSEDFYTIATEGGMKNVQRIEVLRGPQGVLWGRNALGGAVLFYDKHPTDQYEFEAEVTAGNYNLINTYAAASGPIVRDLLRGRITANYRDRDGFLNDTSPFESALASRHNTNYTLAFEATPTDRLTIYARGNRRRTDQKFNGGAGTMPVFLGELSPTGYRDDYRDTSHLAFGFREITPGQNDPLMNNYADPNATTYSFTNPKTGVTKQAQRVRPGIDPRSGLTEPVDTDGDGQVEAYTRGTATSEGLLPNLAYGFTGERLHTLDRGDIDGDEIEVDTNGDTPERMAQQGTQVNIDYEGDNFALKYTFGYADFTYDRNTDEDAVGSTRLGTSEFYVVQEGENSQHAFQLNFTTGSVDHTVGAFLYHSHLNQRLDLYDPLDPQGRFQDTARYKGFGAGSRQANAEAWGKTLQAVAAAPAADTIVQNAPLLNIRTAEFEANAGNVAPDADTGIYTVLAPSYGDPAGQPGQPASRVRSGKFTPGSFFRWSNDLDTKNVAVYWQGKWHINPDWTLTGGLRYTRDEKNAAERLLGQVENPALTPFSVFTPASLLDENVEPEPLPGVKNFIGASVENAARFKACPTNLCRYNVVNGAVDPTDNDLEGTNSGDQPVHLTAPPAEFNFYRPLDTTDDHISFRVNVDYTPNDNTLIYGSVTSGQKSGGFNLGFASNNPIYDEETILSYEIGYKSQLLDQTLQVNTSLYYYDQEDRQTGSSQLSSLGTATAIANAPSAHAIGLEGDITWLPTERLTVGGNWSYTKSEFDKDFTLVDTGNPATPPSLFPADTVTRTLGDGNQQPKIPKWKGTAWVRYDYPLGRLGSLSFASSGSYTGEWWLVPPFNRDIDRAPSFWRWDGSVEWTSVNQRWQVRAYVDNILNSIGVRDLERTDASTNFRRRFFPTNPRQYGLTLSYTLTGG